MDENTRRLAQFLLSEKDTRPHWETDQRAMLMPLVMSGYNNSVSYGVPSFLGGHAWSTMGDIVKGNAVHPDEIAHSANDAAGAAMLGSMPMGATRRGASLGSGGGNTKAPAASALPMDQASRMARAREMGFDVDRPWYHGSANALESGQFEAGHVGASASVKRPWLSEAGHYFADDINHAGIYGDVGEFLLRGKVKDIDLSKIDGGFAKWSKELGYKDPQKAIDSYYAGDIYNALNVDSELLNQSKIAKSEGYDVLRASLGGLTGNGIKGSIAVVFDPKHIRSIDAAFDPAKADSHYLLAANPKTSAAAPLALEAMKDKGGSGIRAYHGSPHNYNAERLVKHPDGRTEYLVGLPDVLPDVPSGATVLQDFPLGRVRMDKIGTGEGAQAFGHGWYAAENEGVAKSYRDILQSPQAYIGNTRLGNVWLLGGSNHYDPGQLAAFYLQKNEGNVAKARAEFDKYSKQGLYDNIMVPNGDGTFRRDDTLPIMTRSFFDRAEKEGYRVTNPGRMYEVNIKADPNHFLDWDKPLSQQSEGVRSAIERVKKEAYSWPSWGDGQLNEAIHLNYAPAEASAKLRDAGIPGVRYLDKGSRSSGKGSHNYVVFDDKLVEILRKYGLAGILAGGYAMTGQEPQE